MKVDMPSNKKPKQNIIFRHSHYHSLWISASNEQELACHPHQSSNTLVAAVLMAFFVRGKCCLHNPSLSAQISWSRRSSFHELTAWLNVACIAIHTKSLFTSFGASHILLSVVKMALPKLSFFLSFYFSLL